MIYKQKSKIRIKSEKRLFLVFFLGSLVWILVVSRLFYLQVLMGAEFSKLAENQHKTCLRLESKRGAIYDRNYELLAFNLPTRSFFAVPDEIQNINSVVNRFSPLVNDTPQQLRSRLKKNKKFVWLKREVEENESQSILSANLAGVHFREETKRYYPHYPLGQYVLGLTNVDNQGLSGIEYQYNNLLSGKDGKAVFLRDALGNSFPVKEYPISMPKPGHSLVLTVDLRFQSIVEEELKGAIQTTGADGGSAVFMNPKTGEILAMAYAPCEDRLISTKNRVISDNFEPGSTFKIVTAAAALQEGIKRPEDKIWAEEGSFKVMGRTIHDIEEHEWLTFKECVVYSSNIGMAKIAMEVGKERIYKYARNLGFGSQTGIDLPGEGKGFIPSPENLSDFTLSIFAIGQGVSLTAIQLLNAYSAVANGGTLMRPYMVKAVLNEEGEVITKFKPRKVRQALHPATAQILIDFLKEVVNQGTGVTVKLEGLNIAGKTGTAQIPKLGGEGYEKGRYLASFVGFFPVENPHMIGLLTLDNPKGKHYGSQTAGPAFKNIAAKILSLQSKPFLITQLPADETDSSYPEEILSYSVKEKEACVFIPDVLGMTAREAASLFTAKNIPFKIKGSGVVKSLIAEAQEGHTSNQLLIIQCEPR
jgi:cell division protein FtsI (penicillin-binding protein 3)